MESLARAPYIQTVAVVVTISVVSVVASFLYQRKRKRTPPKNWRQVAKVTNLSLYPLKSGKRHDLKQAECTDRGMKVTKDENALMQLRDRCMVVYGEGNREYKTARTFPKLLLVEVSASDSDHVAFNAPGMETLYLNIEKLCEEHKQDKVVCWAKEEIFTLDCGDEAARWISSYIHGKDTGLRIGYHSGEEQRDIRKTHADMLKIHKKLNNDGTGLYSDLSSFHLINQASVDDLNDRISGTKISPYNFRPTILIEGPNATAFAEDGWDWIKIGDVVMRNVKPCTRCILTTIDPNTAVRSPLREPLKTLETYRRLKDLTNIDLEGDSPVMGINLALFTSGSISVGDAVFVGA